jgi:hypothetical protein
MERQIIIVSKHSQRIEMLKIFAKKICPYVSLVITILGCGKEMTEPDTELSRQRQEVGPLLNYVISLNGAEASKKAYRMPGPARFEIPTHLRVKSGSTLNKVVEVAYNVNEFDSDDIEFKCSYISSPNVLEMKLHKCVDYDGNDFGNVSGHQFILRFDDIIEIRFTGAASPDLNVEGVYVMKWI